MMRCFALTLALAIPGSTALLAREQLTIEKRQETSNKTESNETHSGAEAANKTANTTVTALLGSNETHARHEVSCGADDLLSIKEKLEAYNATVAGLLDAQEADPLKVLLGQANKKAAGCGIEVRGLMSAKAYDGKFETCLGSTMAVSSGCSQCLSGQVKNSFVQIGLCMGTCVPAALSFVFSGGRKLGAAAVAAEAKCLRCFLPNFATLSRCTGRDEGANAKKFEDMVSLLAEAGESSAVDLVVSFVRTSLDTL